MSAPNRAAGGLALLTARRPEVLQAYFDLTPLLGQTLPAVTRDLVRIAAQTATGAHRALRCTVPRALAAGATPDEVIDAVVLALPEVGITSVGDALSVVAEFVGMGPDEIRVGGS